MRSFAQFLLLIGALGSVGCASKQKAWNAGKTIAVPECSVAFPVHTAGRGYSNQFRNEGVSSGMVIYTPLKEHEAVFQSIADESCDRFYKKLSALGYEVLVGPGLASKSEKYKELQKEQFTKEPDVRDQFIYVGSTKTGVPKGGMGFSVGMGYGSISRNVPTMLIQPQTMVRFGEVKGGGSAVSSTTSTHYSASTAYSPQVSLVRDYSVVPWMGYDVNGRIELSKEYSDDSIAWLNTIKKGDTSTSALSVVGNLFLGSRLEKTTYYTMDINPEKLKEAILAQLDKAEDDYISQIREMKGN